MNIDTKTFGNYRVTKHVDATETVMEISTGYATKMPRTLNDVCKEAQEKATSGVKSFELVEAALKAIVNPI